MAETLRQDPLATRLAELQEVAVRTTGAVTLAHEPLLTQVALRLDPSLADHSPFPLPLTPNTVRTDGTREVLWLGPDEWLILDAPGNTDAVVAAIEHALEDRHHAVLDVGANRVALELGSPGRFDLLAKGCALDLDPRNWGEGRCAQTLLAKTQVVLHERADATSVLVRTSFADYLLDWLLAAAR